MTGTPQYSRASWSDLSGWPGPNSSGVLGDFQALCSRFWKSPAGTGFNDPALDTATDWQNVCLAITPGDITSDSAAESFIEHHFMPVAVSDSGGIDQGLFTGYYEPELHGARIRHGPYQTPLYGRPADLITVDLGQFRDDLKGRHISGRVSGNELVPYYDRTAIDSGVIRGKAPVIAWVDDPVGAFFLEIQGSGRIILEDGTMLRAGYAIGNGRPYTAIGKTLIAEGELSPGEVTAPVIEAWLKAHPDRTQAVMESNASVVFFTENKGDGPVGAAGAVLHPGISLAVDRKSVPLGAMVWLDAAAPGNNESRWQRLMLAEDTGGAITGAVRGDIFFGAGADAEQEAGITKSMGQYWILVPRPIP